MNRTQLYARLRRRRGGLATIALAASTLLTAGVLAATSASAAADYTQSVSQVDATHARIDFTPVTPALYVDVHYTGVPGLGQQNVRMTDNGGTWQHTVGGLTTGTVLDYWFTYEKSGPQFDTPHFGYTQGGGTTTVPTTTVPTTPPTTTTTTQPTGCPTQSDNPNFGPNVRIFDPGMSSASIQAQLDTDFANQKDTQSAQFAERRVAHLFKPGTYNVHDDVGFYTSVAGLGQNPGGVTINGDVTVDAFNPSDAGNAT
ncbi:MAG TPA: hypothetical protein VJX66_19055, partial [Amycolatopsis sp.]|nr:hypothetical protein [Amycolatopsis sp.]